MTDDGLKALTGLRISFVPTRDDVWNRSEFHVDTLHREVAEAVFDAIGDARESKSGSPVGLVVQGQRGSGKTHLLGWVREQVQRQDGYFFLVSLVEGIPFWQNVAHSMLDGLKRQVEGHETQLRVFLRRLTLLVGVPFEARQAIIGDVPLDRDAVEALLKALHEFDPAVASACRHTARALAVFNAGDYRAREVGNNFLLSDDECEPGERGPWALPRRAYPAEQIVSELSWLLALTGPSVIAIDQIDGLLAPMVKAMHDYREIKGHDSVMVDHISNGLMDLREQTHRTLTVVAAQHATWAVICKNAIAAVQDRFVAKQDLGRVPSPSVGRALVAKRLEQHYRMMSFSPPYPTWPIHDDAFDDAVNFMPRDLLKSVAAHIATCLKDGVVRELKTLSVPAEGVVTVVPAPVAASSLDEMDRRFEQLRASADIGRALTRDAEDTELPGLLAAGLQAWIIEHGDAGLTFEQDPPPSTKPALHARLRRTIDEETEEESHWGFRGISPEYHPTAVLNRLRKACTEAGLAGGVANRRVFVLRNAAWPQTPKNVEAVAAFEAAGGRRLTAGDDDLRTLWALRDLLAKSSPDLPAWLMARRPTRSIAFLTEALTDATTGLKATGLKPTDPTATGPMATALKATGPEAIGPEATAPERPAAAPQPEAVPAHPVAAGPGFSLGTSFDTGQPVVAGLEALRKHMAIFAGSGSGKTVLLRRVIEECALQGVSAIVLDPNNDLARLGDAWPEPPGGWAEGDAEKARDYLENTDVVVYTPRRSAGRPISFQPLPAFHELIDDPDEFEAAIDSALATLAPRAKVSGSTVKAERGRAVLKEALDHYARRHRETTLRGFIGMLDELPESVSSLGEGAVKVAAELGQALMAAMVIDPLFGGAGTAVDPGELLTPRTGKRARVSVISLIGLQGEDQRQSFVNQLQMALFAWVKKNPAGDRPLGGLFVMDEAQTLAPSGAMTACTRSTLSLASQARKYGLGLVFATQSPKGLHNQIPGNAATQSYGLMNAPVQIESAREMARAKGGDVPGISQLRTGEFYIALEGRSFTKVRTPLCLSHHPKSPLTTEEVLERARAE
ncbi:DUF87 domain-containing protein [Winogradskya consettensis]|uniref:ATPase n=1 Tax=Winogradskya consettensis TaxID=113560 RepID=A0A919SWJ1_9ACTN|nr:DUF87 domain-containing protein [Actinoplanes consettensis]GIM79289.1 ATPase [Actinoplanes consettensis]